MKHARRLFAFTAVVFRGIVRDRTALFFILVLPVIIIVIIGTTFGGQPQVAVGIVGGERSPVASSLVSELDQAAGMEAKRFDDVDELRRAVRREAAAIGLVFPGDFDERLSSGEPVGLGEVASPDPQTAFTARLALQGVVGAASAQIGAAQLAAAGADQTFAETLALATSLSRESGAAVVVEDVGDERVRGLSRFSLVAPQNLVLFVFINAMAAAVLIVRARRQGVLRRGLATPTSMVSMLAGLGLGWLTFALAQSAVIVGVGALLFGVSWGDPLSAIVLVLIFALVGCGAGLLVGAVGQNEDRVGATAPPVGIVLGALGGCMVPLEVFPPSMRTIAHVTPHFWAVDSWQKLVLEGDGLGAIAPAVGVLAAFAIVLTSAAAAILRRNLAHG